MKTTILSSVLASAVLCPMMLCSCGQPSVQKNESQTAAPSDETEAKVPESRIPAVDLGLSVKWAPCNVGAEKPEDFGNFYAWGETKGMGEEDESNLRNYVATDSCYVKNLYDWATYKFCNGTKSSLTKYCLDAADGTVDGKNALDMDDDAARANMGGRWRMPTSSELGELREKCTWTWTETNGVKGYNVVGPNGNSIFLPAAGCRSNQSRGLVADKGPKNVGGGDYWSSNIGSEKASSFAWRLIFGEKVVSFSYESRCEGATIRAVCE